MRNLLLRLYSWCMLKISSTHHLSNNNCPCWLKDVFLFFCQAGFHIQLLLSYYTVNWPLILYSLCMIMAVSYCYGQKKYISDLCCLSNTKLQETTMTHLVVLFTTVVPVFLVVSHEYCSPLWFKLKFSLKLFFNSYISLIVVLPCILISTKLFFQQMHLLLEHESHAAQHPMHTLQTETYVATAQQF